MDSNTNCDYLFDLVRSLTKSEKVYFKKFTTIHIIGGQNKYAALFDAVSGKSGSKNHQEIVNKFCKEHSIKNFPVLKNYLYLNILKSLKSYYSDSVFEDNLRNEISYIEILYKKGLFKNCVRIINRALKKAYDTENFHIILEILRWKKNLINEGVYEGNEFENLNNTHIEETEILNKIKNLSDYRYLSYLARSLIKGTNLKIKKEDAKTELINILNNPLLLLEGNALSSAARINRLHIMAAVNESLDRNAESFEYRKKLLELMEVNIENSGGNVTNYIVSAYNMFSTCLNLRKFAELDFYIGKLGIIEKKYYKKISENDRMLIIMGSSIYKIRMYFIKGEFSKLIKCVNEIEQSLEMFADKIIKPDMFYFYFIISYSYFCTGKFKEAVSWSNKILNDNSADEKLYIKTKILNMIIHFELGNYDLLDYLLKSAYRMLRKSRYNGFEEIIIMNFIKKLPGVATQTEIKDLFAETLEKLKSIQKFNFRDMHGKYQTEKFEIQNSFTDSAEIDIESWLESKVSGKSFEEVVKQKHKQDTTL